MGLFEKCFFDFVAMMMKKLDVGVVPSFMATVSRALPWALYQHPWVPYSVPTAPHQATFRSLIGAYHSPLFFPFPIGDYYHATDILKDYLGTQLRPFQVFALTPSRLLLLDNPSALNYTRVS